jgi:hypothetical protein
MDVEASHPPAHTQKNTYAFLVAFAAAMGGLLFGYEVGVVRSVHSFCHFHP